jgi:hypothetical protein
MGHSQRPPEGYYSNIAVEFAFSDADAVSLVQNEFRGRSIYDYSAVSELISEYSGSETERHIHVMSEQHIASLIESASVASGKPLPNLNNWYHVIFGNYTLAEGFVEELKCLSFIREAYINSYPVLFTDYGNPTPNFVEWQYYLNDSPEGVSIRTLWDQPGGRGQNVDIVHVESGWYPLHEKYGTVDYEGWPDVRFINGDRAFNYSPYMDHGTAALSLLGGWDSDYGVTGLAPEADLLCSSWYAFEPVRDEDGGGGRPPYVPEDHINTVDAFLLAHQAVNPGDVICTTWGWESDTQHAVCECNPEGSGEQPPEYHQVDMEVLQLLTALGNITVGSAGNGCVHLAREDEPDRTADSGMILVAACDQELNPRCYTNYGSRIDAFAFGSNIVSAGYGELWPNAQWSPGDVQYDGSGREHYTSSFGGTSAAGPIVAGTLACLQSVFKERYNGATLDAWDMRDLISEYGIQQSSDLVLRPIGKLPDAALLLANLPYPYPDDTEGPLVELIYPLSNLPFSWNGFYEIRANVADSHRIGTATLYYRVNQEQWESAVMQLETDNYAQGVYTYQLPVVNNNYNVYEYYIQACDGSVNQNCTNTSVFRMTVGELLDGTIAYPLEGCPSLTRLLSFVLPGAVVELAGGMYTESVEISDQKTVITIRAAENETVVIQGQSEATFSISNGSHLMLEDLIVTADANSSDVRGIEVNDAFVTLTNCEIHGCRSLEDAAGLQLRNSYAYLNNVAVHNNTSINGTGGISSTGNLGVPAVIWFENGCKVFNNDGGTTDNLNIGVGLLTRGPDPSSLVVTDTELTGSNQVSLSLGNTVYLKNIEFRFSPGDAVVIEKSQVAQELNLHIENVLFQGGSINLALDEGSLTNVTLDGVGEFVVQDGHLTVTSSIVGQSIHELSGAIVEYIGVNWLDSISSALLGEEGAPLPNSPCLDQVTSITEFDLTHGDIGWKQRHRVTYFSGLVSSLPLGWYELTDDARIEGDIHPGTVIKIGDSHHLTIASNAQNFDRVLRIGSEGKPRTAIVGRKDSDGVPCASIEITSRGAGDSQHLQLAGVLFNYAPIGNSGDPMDLGSVTQFTGWGSETQQGLELSPETVQFMHYSQVPWLVEGETQYYDAGVVISGSTGLVQGLDFGPSVPGDPIFLQAFSSSLDVQDCTFTPGLTANTSDTPSLKIHSTRPGPETQVHDCTFNAADNRTPYMLDLSMAVVDLERNQFLDAHNTPLILTSSTAHASSEARNHIEGSSEQFLDEQPLITMEGGYLDMYCGRNNLVHPWADEDTPVIYWVPDTSGPPAAWAYWRENYWGYECDQVMTMSELTDLDLGYLPAWAHVEDNLSVCLPQTAPNNPYCPFYGDTPFDLLNDGKGAETRGDYGIAHLNYSAVLVLHSVSKEANEATLRLKALGLHKTYGAENFVTVRDDLFQARENSRTSNMKRQAVLQGCSGWCVEARWGNRPSALDTLNAWYAKETDQLNKDTIKLALLEIATYPVPGQLSAAGPEAQMASAVIQQEAVNALLNFKRGQGSDEEGASVLPQTFQISNLYPIPFNARTTIVLQVPEESKVQVEVYNLLGQLVSTLHNGVLPAGEHRVVANGENWASGLYFVTATSIGKVQVRKMLLVK